LSLLNKHKHWQYNFTFITSVEYLKIERYAAFYQL